MTADKELIELIERLAEDAFNEGWRDRESRRSPRPNSRAAMRTAWRGSNARDAILNPIGEAAARLEVLQPSPETSLQNMQTRGAVGREEVAEAVHLARFPVGRESTPFTDEDRSGHEYCYRIADAILALFSSSPTVEGWQPIESAPKDGTVVLVAHASNGAIFSVQWDALTNGWIDGACDGFGDPITYDPSHWQPLPPAPTTEGK